MLPRPLLLAGLCLLATLGASACGDDPADAPDEAPSAATGETRRDRLAATLRVLAHDSLRGRRAGTEGAERAAAFLADRLRAYGVEPAGDSAFFQAVPLASRPDGRLTLEAGPGDGEPRVPGAVNVVGIVRGADPEVADEAVVLGAHFDHLGVRPGADGDSIYNGADDDATGTAAVIEIARALAERPPRRTVVVLLSTAEEQGLLGTRWYMDHPAVPLERTVADFQIEMIGRPDSLAGGPGRGWLTGYERTTMGDQLAGAGSPIVPDPRPEMRFFFRSDNVPFALAGIPAHTLSSYGMHGDYHQPSDEFDTIDLDHMRALVDAAEAAVRYLADGPRPAWKEGGREGLGPG